MKEASLLSQELLAWIAKQNAILKEQDSKTVSAENRERIFWQLAKLTEETGELADAVLAFHKLQCSEKAGGDAKENIALECADVIIVTLLLADRLGIDVENALGKKSKRSTRVSTH